MPRTFKVILFVFVLSLLCINTALAQENVCSLAEQHLVYASDVSGDWEIYLQTLGEPVNLTQNLAEDRNQDVSSDGRWMVFHSFRGGSYEIWKIDLSNPQPHNTATILADNGTNDVHFYDASWSPDGSQIVFKKDELAANGHGDIWIMDADGSNQRNLTADRTDTEEWVPKFSEDGSRIYFVSRLSRDIGAPSDELFVMNIDGSGVEQLTFNDVSDWYPAVNPVTGEVAYISRETPDGDENIYRLEPDGHKTPLVTLPGDDNDPVWDCRGALTFINNYGGHYEIYTKHFTEGDILSPEVSG